MADYKEAYVYNAAIGEFEEMPTTLSKLVEMKRRRDGRLSLIKNNLYSQKEKDDKYKLVFVYPKERKAYLRRLNADSFRRYGFASVCESNLHKACKCGLAEAKSVKIKIDGNVYVINKKSSCTEKICELMDCQFETDCEYEIEDINCDLETMLGGNIICFEIHHTSEVNDKKGLAYMLSGKPIIEFHIQEKYIPSKVLTEKCSYQESIDYFKDYYEDTEKHYIEGTFFRPYDFKFNWNKNHANVLVKEEKEVEVIVFRKENSYRILYLIDGNKIYVNDYFGENIKKRENAKRYAEYRLQEHLSGRILLKDNFM